MQGRGSPEGLSRRSDSRGVNNHVGRPRLRKWPGDGREHRERFTEDTDMAKYFSFVFCDRSNRCKGYVFARTPVRRET